MINTEPAPGTQRIAVDRHAAAQGKPPILLIEQNVRASRVQIKCPCCNIVVVEVRWSGNTTQAPAVWVEVSDYIAMNVFSDIAQR
jgi:hypothetical protein